MSDSADGRHLSCMRRLVMAYVSNNRVPAAALPSLIETMHMALRVCSGTLPPQPAPADRPSADRIRRSVTPEALVSFIDGRRYKTLKRHLTSHGLTPDLYRERYGLSHDYPMTAPDYSRQRAQLAREIGLGVHNRDTNA